MDSPVILVLEIMTLKVKYNKMSEVIFCLGSHTGCNIGKMGGGVGSMCWEQGGGSGLWSSGLRQPPGRGGKAGAFRGQLLGFVAKV